MRRTIAKYEVDVEQLQRSIFLMDTNYKLNTTTLLNKVKSGLRMLVVRLLPDIVDGSIKLDNPGRILELAELVCS